MGIQGQAGRVGNGWAEVAAQQAEGGGAESGQRVFTLGHESGRDHPTGGIHVLFKSGQVVIAKERSELEDVWADEIQLRSRTRAGHLYGRRVHLENGCEVEGVTYTEELRSDPSVRMRNVPQKVEKLPEPPF